MDFEFQYILVELKQFVVVNYSWTSMMKGAHCDQYKEELTMLWSMFVPHYIWWRRGSSTYHYFYCSIIVNAVVKSLNSMDPNKFYIVNILIG